MKKGYKSKKNFIKKTQIEHNKKLLWHFLITFALVCFLLASFFAYYTYSLWNPTYSQSDVNKITAGCFELQISDLNENQESTSINLKNAYPMTEDKGLSTSPYLLNITNICDVPSEYTVILNKFETTTLSDSLIRYHISNSEDSLASLLLSDTPILSLDDNIKNEIETEQGMSIIQSYNLSSGYLNKGESASYELRIWLDYNATKDEMNKRFEAGVMVLSTSPQ